MSKLQRAFIATSDKTYKKVKGKDGITYHFKDGTPIKESTFNMVASKYMKQEGQYTNVAVPSNKGPGYERKQVDPREASSLGQNLSILRHKRDKKTHTDREVRRETFEIDGEEYSLDELYDLNKRITDRHGNDAVMRYT